MARLFSQPAQGLSPAGVFTAPGGQRFRFGPWRREPSAGHLVPLGGLVDGLSALAATDHLQGLGYKEIFTSALTLHERDPFLSLGYEVDQELTLLKRPLGLAVSPLKKPRSRGPDTRISKVRCSSFTQGVCPIKERPPDSSAPTG